MKVNLKSLYKKDVSESQNPVYTGENKNINTSVFTFSRDKNTAYMENGFIKHSDGNLRWINAEGLNNYEKITEICNYYNIDQMTTEDIFHINQRNKIEFHDNYIYIVLKLVNKKDIGYEYEQLSIIFTDNTIITFNERVQESLRVLMKRLYDQKVITEGKKNDFLLYYILDVIVDKYFIISNEIVEKVEMLDDSINMDPDKEDLIKIKGLKQEILYFKRNINTLKDTLYSSRTDLNIYIQSENREYYRDLYDHVSQLSENTEILKDTVSNLTEIYFSAISYKMNEIMKVLTIISTIFIPLSFLAGLYGMNFRYMPELEWHMGYPLIVGIMVIIVVIMLLVFKKKKWF